MFRFNADLLAWHLHTAQQAIPTHPKQEDPIAGIIQEAIAATCTIYVSSPDGQRWTGSGFHLGGGLIATAAHVAPPEFAQGPGEIALTFDQRTLLPATIALSDPSVDSAILYCPHAAQLAPSVTLAKEQTLNVGDIIAVISSPEGWHHTATVGRISNVHQSLGTAGMPSWNDVVFIDAEILEGSSGGLVIGTDGLVVGSVIGLTGRQVQIGVGERAICPSYKIKHLLQQVGGHVG